MFQEILLSFFNNLFIIFKLLILYYNQDSNYYLLFDNFQKRWKDKQ